MMRILTPGLVTMSDGNIVIVEYRPETNTGKRRCRAQHISFWKDQAGFTRQQEYFKSN